MSFSKAAKILKCTDVEEYTLEDGNLVLFKRNPEYTHVLNETAAFIWNECHMKSFDETVASLAAALMGLEIGMDELVSDCKELFEDMLNKGLITLGEQ